MALRPSQYTRLSLTEMKSTSSEQYVGLLQKKERKMQSSENCWDWMYSVCCWRKGRPTRLEHAECEADGDSIKGCRILVSNYKCQHFYWWEMFRTRWEMFVTEIQTRKIITSSHLNTSTGLLNLLSANYMIIQMLLQVFHTVNMYICNHRSVNNQQ